MKAIPALGRFGATRTVAVSLGLAAAGLLLMPSFVRGQGPQTAADYFKLAQQKETSGDLNGALAAFIQVLSLNANKDESSDMALLSQDSIARGSRDNLQMATGDLDDALKNYSNDRPPSYIGIGLNSCFIWVIQNKEGQKAAADQELSGTLTATASGMLNLKDAVAIAKFLLNTISESDLVAGLSANQMVEGYYFIGEKHLLAGDANGATLDFQKAVALKGQNLEIGMMAQAELKTIGRGK